jgi:pyruvate formate lyase activating enzyme
MTQGKVHSIDTFSTLDGPGIRMVVFMQGCHLRCKYCQNPDTWNLAAPSAREYSPHEILKIALRNLPYFASGGGITISGGEPLLQADFVKEVFQLCREHHIHTAVDTSLYVSGETVLDLIPYTNLFLADIKHINEEKSRNLTGASNKLNTENLNLINDKHGEIWIRYVVVPGITDGTDDLLKAADFIKTLDSVTRVDLLPYHSLGKHKWKLLGLKYELEDIELPSLNRMQELQYLVADRSNKPVFVPT